MIRYSIWDFLSYEILERIIFELRKCDSWTHYCSMRLACKAINDIVEPQAFSSLTIHFTEQNMGTVLSLLPSLASGATPHVRWARHLRVHNLISPGSQSKLGDLVKPDPNRERLLECQNEWLVPAIMSLTRVEEIECHAPFEPSDPVLCAMAELPRIRSLKVWFKNQFRQDIPLSRFANLSVLELHDLVFYRPVLDGVKQAIASSPSLHKLAISKYRWGVNIPIQVVEFDSVIEGALRLPTFIPTLTQLDVDVGGFRLRDSCIPFLSSLTHLDIRRLSGKGVPPSFWQALGQSGVLLQRLALCPLDQSIVDYLLSYVGLWEIVLDYTRSVPQELDADREAIVKRFFHSVIPQHKETLREICFGCRGGEPWEVAGLIPWIVVEPHLEAISLCESLEHLDLVCFFPSPNEKVLYPSIPLEELFSTVFRSLPQLHKLGLMHVRNFHKYKGGGRDYEIFYNRVAKAFTTHIRKSLPRKTGSGLEARTGFAVEAIGPTCIASRSTRYHITVDADRSEGVHVDEDEDVSDSDADSVDNESPDGFQLWD